MTNSTVTITPWGCTVILGCGIAVNSVPQNTKEYHITSNDLGYGDDTIALAQDHDALHIALCSWLGLPESYSLQQAANLPTDKNLASLEEATIMALQKFAKHANINIKQLVKK